MPVLLFIAAAVEGGGSVDLKTLLASPVDLTVYSPDRKTGDRARALHGKG